MDDPLKYKSKKVDITPDFPCRLTGMGEDERSKGVFNNLEVNAMIFRNGSNNIYLVSIDTLFISGELKSMITEAINQTFGPTDESNIILVSSHTHYAPSLEAKRIKLGRRDEKYLEYLNTKLQTLFEELKAEPLQNIVLKSAAGKSDNLTCSRRRRARLIRSYFHPIIAMEPNPGGFKKEEFKILNVHNADNNQLLGIVWSFPCHPTNFPDRTMVTSEFPGLIRESIRSKNDFDSSIVYLPGMAGDVRAYPPKRRSIKKFIRKVLNLSYKVSDYRFIDKDEYLSWTASLTETFWDVNRTKKTIQLNNSRIDSAMIKEPVRKLGIETDSVEDLIYRKFSIGNYFAIYTISAEPVSYYSKIFEANSKEEFAIYTGYVDEVFGYLPTNEQVVEGGYESKGFFDGFLVKGAFLKTMESTVASNIKSLSDGS